MKSFTLKEIKSILSEYNIPFCPTELANSKEEAIRIANSFDYPVVLKAFSLEGAHKTELGLVKKDIENDNELSDAWDEIVKVKADGTIVQKQIFGLEIIVGMKRDVQFGPVLMFGIGGVLVDIMKDVTFRIAPVFWKCSRI
jgi:acyl-CoA synthetase (NDP forming)